MTRRPTSLLKAAWLLTLKDLRLYRRDRIGLALGFLMPLGLVGVFGLIMGSIGGGSSSMGRVELAVADLSNSPRSAALIEALSASGTLAVVRPKQGDWTRADVRERLSEGDEPFALVIPPDFANGTSDLQLLRDPGREIEQQLLAFGLTQALIELDGEDAPWAMSRRLLLKSGIPEEWVGRVDAMNGAFRFGLETLLADAEADGHLDTDEAFVLGGGGKGLDMGALMTALLPVQLVDIKPDGIERRLSYQVTHAVSGMTVMMLMFTLVSFGRTLIVERQQGTLLRLRCSPIPPVAILLGKMFATVVVGMVLVAVLFGFAALVFEVDVLSRLGTLSVLSLATILACAGFASAIAAWARTDKQADGISTLLILLMSAIGGAWVPDVMMPDVARSIGRFTITQWSVRAFQGSFWYDLPWYHEEQLLRIGVLLGVAVALFSLSAWMFQKRYLDA